MSLDRYQKTKTILGVITILCLAVYLFRDDVYVWLCRHEDNNASCMLAGDYFESKNQSFLAQDYFSKSCQLNYALACYRLSLITKDEIKSRALLIKACQLGHQEACLQQKTKHDNIKP